jgi:NAD(P)-dependent dehydrogenase (short-subunit alcohol dehydrogenase family)
MASRNKVAFITGANKGIGLETARGLGGLGITVVLGSRDEGKDERLPRSFAPRARASSRPYDSTSRGPRTTSKSCGISTVDMARSTSW